MATSYTSPEIFDCPLCGALPELLSQMGGFAYACACAKCGWEGGTRDCGSIATALYHWNEKVSDYE